MTTEAKTQQYRFNMCRLCKDDDLFRPLVRYGIRHYCHPECGFAKWGDDLLRKIPSHEIGSIPWRLLTDPKRAKLALELCPDNIRVTIARLYREKQATVTAMSQIGGQE
jgi:hypothetical protein